LLCLEGDSALRMKSGTMFQLQSLINSVSQSRAENYPGAATISANFVPIQSRHHARQIEA
jgi:hypothetical protein